MTPIVDIMTNVIEAMKPIFTGSISESVGTGIYRVTETTIGDWIGDDVKLYVGQKVLMTTSGGVEYYGEVTEININRPVSKSNFKVDVGTTGIITFASVQPLINFHYGHPLEVVNELSERLLNSANKTLQFPVIFLPMDFEEERNAGGYDATADLSFVLMIDTKPEYKAADRYTYSFDTHLYPLYDLFIKQIEESKVFEVEKDGSALPVHTKIDRLYWGKSGLYGNTGNIFNDYIDAIEINNLKVKILKTC